MAKIILKTTDEIALRLSKLEAKADAVARKAIYAGAVLWPTR
jgi:hypothetical protein